MRRRHAFLFVLQFVFHRDLWEMCLHMYMSLCISMRAYLPNAVEGVVVSALCVHMRAYPSNAVEGVVVSVLCVHMCAYLPNAKSK